VNGERESFGEEFREALGDLLAARKTSEHGTRAWNTARDLAGGPGNLLPPAAAAAAKERAEGLGDYEDELNIALADARGLLEATAGSVDPAREVLEAAVEEITAAEQKGPSAAEPSRAWLRSWEEILAEPEPEGGDWLVEDLLGKQSLGAVQGFAKTAKTWVVLELATAIVMGRPAFGRFEVTEPGPVIVVLEESPPKMTRKRLDALGRGHNVLHGKPGLYVSSNERVRLGPDDDGWRERIREMAKAIRPRAVLLDPLVRIKGEEVDENEQKEISSVLHFLADLRDEFTCATVFAHHTGHADKRRFRGSSDLEAFWSDKIALEETGGGKHRHLQAFHRDAPPSEKYEFRLAWRPETETMRVEVVGQRSKSTDLQEKLLAHVGVHPGESKTAVWRAVGGRKEAAFAELDRLAAQGLVEERDGGWYLPSTGGSGASGTASGEVAVPTLGNRSEPEPLDLAPQSGNDRFPDHGNRREPRASEGGSRLVTPRRGEPAEPTEPERRWGTAREDDGQAALVDTVDGVLARFPGTREEVA